MCLKAMKTLWLGTMISTENSASKVLIGSVGMILSGDVVLVQARVGVDRTLILVGTNSGSFSVRTFSGGLLTTTIHCDATWLDEA